MKNWAIVVLLSGWLSLTGKAQQYPVYQLGMREALPHAIVYRTMEDSRGFLWISTEGGVARYDGHRMQRFDQAQGLGGNVIIHTSEGPGPNIYANVYNAGIWVLEGERWREDTAQFGKWPRQPVKTVYAAGRLWCLENTAYLYAKVGNRIERETSLDVQPMFKDIAVGKSGELLATTYRYPFTYSEEEGWEMVEMPAEIDYVNCLTLGPEQELWVANKLGVYQVEAGEIRKRLTWNEKHAPDHLAVTKAGKIWAANFGGLYVSQGDSFVNATARIGQERVEINDLTLDHQGNLWLSTYGDGLICVLSTSILNFPADPEYLRGPVNAFAQFAGTTWVASMGMLSYFEGGKWQEVPSPHLQAKSYPYFVQAWEGDLLVGTAYTVFSLTPEAPTRQVRFAEEGATSALSSPELGNYIGTFAGMYREGEATYEKMPGPLETRRIMDIAQWRAELVIATDSGLYHQNAEETASFGLAADAFVLALQVDQQARLWAATNQGVYRLEPAADGTVAAQQLRGFPQVQALCEDRQGRMWLGTNAGLFGLGPQDTLRLDASQGLISNQVRCLSLDSSGNLWVGASEGISKVDLDQIHQARMPVQMRITSLSYDSVQLAFPEEITLSTRNRNIRIGIAGVRYPVNSDNNYRYRIKGLQDEWLPLDGQILQFSAFPVGDFVLEVAAGRGGKPPEEVARLLLHVEAPFYETGWFRLLLVLLGAVLLAWLAWWMQARRLRQTRRSLEQRLRYLMLRTQALQAMVNPHFIFNSLNAVLGLIQADRKTEAKAYVTGFSRLLRTTLERSGNADISVGEEIEALRLYLQLQQKRFGERLRYEVDCDPEIDPYLRIPNMLLQPFVENAVQHGIAPAADGGLISIRMRKHGDAIDVIIEDDGVGMPGPNAPPREGRAMGIALIRQRLALLEEICGLPQRLSISARTPEPGTRVAFLLTPLDMWPLAADVDNSQ